MSLKVKFWGVRGSIACPSPNHIGFGGNTSCVEVSADGHRFILDAGTGVRNLGHWIFRKGPRRATFLFSHTHWDHITGFPFFAPAFHPDYEFVLQAGHLNDQGGLQRVIAGQMSNPIFPVPLEAMRSKLSFEDFKAGDCWHPEPGVTIRTAPLNHPNGATGYRIEHLGKSICYVTDTEHVPGKPDESILGLIEGADLVIYDSTYTDNEFPAKVSWGHSTWQEGVRLAMAAGAKSLAIFHHDPDHEDRFMEQIEADARTMWLGAFVARENMRLVLA
jgi:phosphoribosyl 1,2-cyclic phosphodiesterase